MEKPDYYKMTESELRQEIDRVLNIQTETSQDLYVLYECIKKIKIKELLDSKELFNIMWKTDSISNDGIRLTAVSTKQANVNWDIVLNVFVGGMYHQYENLTPAVELILDDNDVHLLLAPSAYGEYKSLIDLSSLDNEIKGLQSTLNYLMNLRNSVKES